MIKKSRPSYDDLGPEIADLRARLDEAEDTLQAIRTGERRSVGGHRPQWREDLHASRVAPRRLSPVRGKHELKAR